MIIYDCDDVLLDWCGGFKNWVNRVHGLNVTGEPETWDLSEWIGTDDARQLIIDFNSSPDFNWLKPCPGARETVKGKTCVLTSCSTDPKIQTARRFNLKMVFGNDAFQDIFCLDLGQSKLAHLQALHTLYGPCTWIEDNVSHAKAGLAAGHRSVVIRRPHNRHLEQPGDGLRWVDSLFHV